jgi:hypothetical protein
MKDELKAVQEFVEICKERFTDCQRRFGTAHQNLQKAQQEFAQAQLEHNNWQGVLNSELARLARLQQAAQENQGTLPMVPAVPNAIEAHKQVPLSASESAAEINKTELVRELLSQHAEGMTPGEVWAVLKNQIPRPYVYSILKRLKDADEVIYNRRRKRYSLRVNAKNEEEIKDQPSVIH